MSTVVAELPVRRLDLVIRPLGENGRYVVKNPGTDSYFQIGEQEHFLLTLLDGQHDVDTVCRKFATHFAEPLSAEDLDGFVALARKRQLVREAAEQPSEERIARPRQSILYWRTSLFDPDRFCTWLEPRIRFFWTRTFLVFSAGCILLAMGLLWAERAQAATSALSALRWETVLAVWVTLFVVTMLHEFAHGLTCKHFGGEVHEIGFLLMYFMPCFYCNVSDAWLFRERSKRLWVTFAGGYFEVFLWSLAVFAWRLAQPGTTLHYLSFVVLSACGVQTLFNLNPLLKLDGYYLLSDWLEIPNLRQKSVDYVKAHLRALLWGALRPTRNRRGAALVGYGVLSWTYSLLFVGLMLVGFARFLGARWGIVGFAAVALLVVPTARGLLGGLTGGELSTMIRKRHKRTVFWALLVAALGAASLVNVEDRIGGTCSLRPTARCELRAPLAGFIAEVHVDEGDRVSPGQCAIRLSIPDLDSRIVQKQAEGRESESKLNLLEAGARPEELAEQRQRVERALAWRELAAEDVQHARQGLTAELERLEHATAKAQAQLTAARQRFQRADGLAPKRAMTKDEYEQVQLNMQMAELDGEQLRAARSALAAKGTRDSEAELARREKDLADARGTLTLMAAGTRPEEIEAERARLARLAEELHYLQGVQAKLLITSSVAGTVTTPRLKEKVGQYVREGDLIGLVEEPAALEAEIALDEQQIERLDNGLPVSIKLRAVPFETYWANVDRVAPAAAKADEHDPQARVNVYCRLDAAGDELCPGMTGYARIYTGQRPLGQIAIDRTLRMIRTEFWW